MLDAGDALWPFDGSTCSPVRTVRPLPHNNGGTMPYDFVHGGLVVTGHHTTRLVVEVTPPASMPIGQGGAIALDPPRLTSETQRLGHAEMARGNGAPCSSPSIVSGAVPAGDRVKHRSTLYALDVPTDDLSLTTAEIRAARGGDRTAIDNLLSRYMPRVQRIVAARMGRGWRELALAEDLVQETILEAFTALSEGQIRDDGSFCSWIARCAQNRVLSELRHGRARKRGAGGVARFADLGESFLATTVFADGSPSASQHASCEETETLIERELAEIDPRYREVICLRAYCGMSHAAVAKEMGLPSENTANALFLRARKALEQRLAQRGLP